MEKQILMVNTAAAGFFSPQSGAGMRTPICLGLGLVLFFLLSQPCGIAADADLEGEDLDWKETVFRMNDEIAEEDTSPTTEVPAETETNQEYQREMAAEISKSIEAARRKTRETEETAAGETVSGPPASPGGRTLATVRAVSQSRATRTTLQADAQAVLRKSAVPVPGGETDDSRKIGESGPTGTGTPVSSPGKAKEITERPAKPPRIAPTVRSSPVKESAAARNQPEQDLTGGKSSMTATAARETGPLSSERRLNPSSRGDPAVAEEAAAPERTGDSVKKAKKASPVQKLPYRFEDHLPLAEALLEYRGGPETAAIWKEDRFAFASEGLKSSVRIVEYPLEKESAKFIMLPALPRATVSLRFSGVPAAHHMKIYYGFDTSLPKSKEQSFLYFRVLIGKHELKAFRLPVVPGWKSYVLGLGIVEFLKRNVDVTFEVTSDYPEEAPFVFQAVMES